MPSDYKQKVEELSNVLGLKEDIFKPIKTFSGGMKRKLEIMRTLIHKPKVLFLDEPTSGLDPLSRKNLWEYLKGIKKRENTTIFLTTHYLEEAEGADTVCIINHGKVVINDSLSNVKKKLLNDYIYIESEPESFNDLKNELVSLGYKFSPQEQGFKIDLDIESAQNIIKSVQTKLTKILISQPTLEDTYIDLVKEPDE